MENVIRLYSIWEHKKSGEIYTVFNLEIDANNNAQSTYSVRYAKSRFSTYFHRNAEEFLEKFEEVKENDA